MAIHPLVVGIAGGSGSGKTTVAAGILQSLPPSAGVLLEQDHYYRPLSHLCLQERERVNYDHPDALEIDLLCAHLDELRAGRFIERPTYDFTVHDRHPRGLRIDPAPVIVVEGIL